MGHLAIIIGKILDLPSLITLFFVYKSKKFWHVLLAVLVSAVINEFLQALVNPAYKPLVYFIHTFIAQFIVGFVFYLILARKRRRVIDKTKDSVDVIV